MKCNPSSQPGIRPCGTKAAAGVGSLLDCAGDDARDDVFLRHDIKGDYRCNGEGEARHGKIPLNGEFAKEGVGGQGDRAKALGRQHKGGQQKVVPDPYHIQNDHRHGGGLQHGKHDPPKKRPGVAAVQRRCLLNGNGYGFDKAMIQKHAHAHPETDVHEDNAEVAIEEREPCRTAGRAHELHQGHHDGLERDDHRCHKAIKQDGAASAGPADHQPGGACGENDDEQDAHKRDNKGIFDGYIQVHFLDRSGVVFQVEERGQPQWIQADLGAVFEGIDENDVKRREVDNAKYQKNNRANSPCFFMHYISTSLRLVKYVCTSVISATMAKKTMAFAWP